MVRGFTQTCAQRLILDSEKFNINASYATFVAARAWGLAERPPASQVQLAKINESPPFDVANGSTLRSKSCLADRNTPTLAPIIPTGSPDRIKRPKPSSHRNRHPPTI